MFWRRNAGHASDGQGRVRDRGGRWRRRAALLTVLVVLVAAASASGVWFWRGGSTNEHPARTAVIVDQLSLTAPNQEFVDTATGILQDAGYSVSYYPGEQVTVDLYRELAAQNYDLVILRVHSAPVTVHNDLTGQTTNSDFLSLFTGEPYSGDKYQQEQDLGRIARSRYLRPNTPGEYVFGIVPSFVQRSMQGRFNGAPIIMMGCDGLRSQTTAQAFLDKGASDFVSWSQPVSSVHTDQATERLLQRYLKDHESLADAVKDTAAEVGPDPYFGGELRLLSSTRKPANAG